MKHVLIGGTGFVGTGLQTALTRIGQEVSVLGKKDYDVTDLSSKLPSADMYWYLPALVHAIDPRGVKTMVDATGHQANVLLKTQKPVVLISSTAVHGVNAASGVTEGMPLFPNTLYGMQKAFQEVVFDEFKSNLLILRPAHLYGRNSLGVVEMFSRAAIAGTALTVNGMGLTIQDLSWINTFAAYVADFAVNMWHGERRVLPVGTGVARTISNLAYLIIGMIPETGANVVREDKPEHGTSAWVKSGLILPDELIKRLTLRLSGPDVDYGIA